MFLRGCWDHRDHLLGLFEIIKKLRWPYEKSLGWKRFFSRRINCMPLPVWLEEERKCSRAVVGLDLVSRPHIQEGIWVLCSDWLSDSTLDGDLLYFSHPAFVWGWTYRFFTCENIAHIECYSYYFLVFKTLWFSKTENYQSFRRFKFIRCIV